MSGLEFLFRKTLSDPGTLNTKASPENFKEAMDEFVEFCEEQVPKIQETDFIPTCFDITISGEEVVIGGKHGNITIYDMSTQKKVSDQDISRFSIQNILLAMNDKYIAAADSSQVLYFFEYPSLDLIHKIDFKPQPLCIKLGGSKNAIYCSNYENDLRIIEIFVGKKDKEAKFFERKIETNEVICCIDVSEDGSLLAFGLKNGVIKLIHGESENELQATSEHSSAPVIISFSEHRRHIGVGFEDFILRV